MEGAGPLILGSPNQISHPSSSGEESEGVEVVEQSRSSYRRSSESPCTCCSTEVLLVNRSDLGLSARRSREGMAGIRGSAPTVRPAPAQESQMNTFRKHHLDLQGTASSPGHRTHCSCGSWVGLISPSGL